MRGFGEPSGAQRAKVKGTAVFLPGWVVF